MAISDIAVPISRKPGPPCAVCGQLKSLPQAEATALRGLLADTTWRYTELSDELEREGVNLSPFMLSWHARGKCEAREKLR